MVLKRKATYSIKWERNDFTIRKSWLGTAKLEGPQKKGNWNKDITSGKQKFYGTIFRAAHHYYYKDIQGLRRPPQNSFWNTKLRIRAYYETNSSNGTHCAACRFLGLGSAIKIYNPDRLSMHIYGTVIHELAHASHWKMSSDSYGNSPIIVYESWARGVQWSLTRMRYSNYNLQSYYSRRAYTGMVQDLIDGPKTTISFYYYLNEDNPWVSLTRSYSDQVSGYTIRQIEDALVGQTTWNGWRNRIKNLYSNETKNFVDDVFHYWNLQ